MLTVSAFLYCTLEKMENWMGFSVGRAPDTKELLWEAPGVLGVHRGSRTCAVCAPGSGRVPVLCSAPQPSWGQWEGLGLSTRIRGSLLEAHQPSIHAGLKFAPRFS